MNEWLWTYEGYDALDEGQRETLCTLGNGYVATRGALAETEADGVHYPGTYLAGVFNRLTTEVAGRDVVNESIVNVPNWLVLRVRIDGGDWISPDSTEVLEHHLETDLRRATLTRRTRFRDDQGRTFSLTERRFVSLADPHVLALETTFVAEDFAAPIEILSALDGTVENRNVVRYNTLDTDHLVHVRSEAVAADTVLLEVRTNDSDIVIAQGARTRLWRNGEAAEPERATDTTHRWAAQTLALDVEPGDEVRVEKVVTIYSSRDNGIYSPPEAAARRAVAADDFEDLLAPHLTAWKHSWNRSRITLSGEFGHTARILNLHIFHLLATVSKNTTDLDVGVPARGLHGEAYRGHIFWDEMYIFPFLTLRVPELTRSLLLYRARRLGAARNAAREAGFAGAMYPWQSGSDGREETQVVHLNPKSGRWLPDASHLQRHVNAAIVFNIWQYWQATGDREFMRFWGAEMVLEVARFWASTATYNHALDRYEIKGVMGPDEFHEGYPDRDLPGLDNNSYTNVMAVWCLCRALDVLDALPGTRRAELLEKLHLDNDEIDRWGDISRKMRLCFHNDGILSQFEGYEDLEELDWAAYRAKYGDIGRLDRILEAEGDSPNRYKLAKQADTVMLLQMLSIEELADLWERLGYEFDPAMIPKTVDYYEQRTSHGSTLSVMVHAWLHSKLDRAKSWSLFRFALESDINDVQGGTTREGIHLGAMAGTVDLIQRCYGGIETRDGTLHINPCLPDEVHSLSFTLNYRRQFLQLEISHESVRLRLAPDSGEQQSIAVEVVGERIHLGPGDSLERSLV